MSWEQSLDEELFNPPESNSKCECGCGYKFECGEDYYSIEGEIMCEDCATEWLDNQKHEVTWEMARGL